MTGFFQHTQADDAACISEDMRLATELKAVQVKMEIARGLFDMTSDMDMIDYHIHQLKALEAQYSSLLKAIKAQRTASSEKSVQVAH